jgi:hypothetical protein
MNSAKLQDRIYLALGKSARQMGTLADAYRPTRPSDPLDRQNRFLRLPAIFTRSPGGNSASVYGEPLWTGTFDASYTRTGDYIVLDKRIYFIASQEPLLPVLCVLTNRTISIARPNLQTMAATNPYGGYTAGASNSLMTRYPASVLGETRSASPTVDLPTDQAVPYWSVLLPAAPGVILLPGDLITDDLDRSAVIIGSELTHMGWRINAKMATT